MFRASTGESTQDNAKLAGREAAQKAKKNIERPKMAYVYASCVYNHDEMLAGIADELPGVPIIGNTSFTGVITPAGFITGDSGFVGMMIIEDEDMAVGVYAAEKVDTPRKTGQIVAKAAMEKAQKESPPDYFYMVAPPGEEEFYLKGITDVIGRVPCFGGSAADNTITGEWKIYTERGAFADGVAVAFFYTNKHMSNHFTGAYRETSDVGIITKVEGNRTLLEIDGVPALDKYAQWRHLEVDQLLNKNLLVETIVSPLGVKDRLGDLVAIRHPMNGNANHSMDLGNQLAVNTAIIRMEATTDELIASTSTTLSQLRQDLQHPSAYHLVHCGGRRAGIGDRIEEVVEQIKESAGQVPFIVEFTFGEYGFEQDGSNTCGGLMLSFTGFEG